MKTKTATIRHYEMYGTRGEYSVEVIYRGKILREWQGQYNERELIGQAASWARTIGKFNRVSFES